VAGCAAFDEPEIDAFPGNARIWEIQEKKKPSIWVSLKKEYV
jgi:hypothetical protein